MPSKTVQSLILGALKNLGELNFREFCDKLTDLEEKQCIRVSEVENMSRLEITKLLVSRFSSRALDITVRTLTDIGCNNEADKLKKEAEELESAVRPQPVRRSDRSRSTRRSSTDHPQPSSRRERSRSPHLRSSTRPSSSRDSIDSAPQSDAKDVLSSARPKFVKNVSEPVLDQLLDHLLKKKVLNPLEMESVKAKPRADKAREIVDAVIKKSSRAASILIEEFCKLDPTSELCDLLKP